MRDRMSCNPSRRLLSSAHGHHKSVSRTQLRLPPPGEGFHIACRRNGRSAGDLRDILAKTAGSSPAPLDLAPSTDPKAPSQPDYWTSITVEISSSYSAEQSSSSSNSYSAVVDLAGDFGLLEAACLI